MFSGEVFDLRAKVSQHIDVDLAVSPEITTKQPQRQEQGKIVRNVLTIEKHKTWHNKAVVNVFINEHIRDF